jgi:hypothetical protein
VHGEIQGDFSASTMQYRNRQNALQVIFERGSTSTTVEMYSAGHFFFVLTADPFCTLFMPLHETPRGQLSLTDHLTMEIAVGYDY